MQRARTPEPSVSVALFALYAHCCILFTGLALSLALVDDDDVSAATAAPTPAVTQPVSPCVCTESGAQLVGTLVASTIFCRIPPDNGVVVITSASFNVTQDACAGTIEFEFENIGVPAECRYVALPSAAAVVLTPLSTNRVRGSLAVVGRSHRSFDIICSLPNTTIVSATWSVRVLDAHFVAPRTCAVSLERASVGTLGCLQ